MKSSRPSTLSRALALVPPTAVLVAQHASASFSTFLKIDTVDGDATEKSHLGWIAVNSAQWGVGRAISLAGGGGDRETSAPSFSDVTVSKAVDRSTPYLFLAAVAGSPYSTDVKLELVDDSTARVYYRLTLSDVLITSQSCSAATGDDKAQESVSLNFAKIKVEGFDASGKMIYSYAWDLAKNQPF